LATIQLRNDTPAQVYYRRKLADDKSSRETIRSLRPRLSDTVYKQLVTDSKIYNSSHSEPPVPFS
jgi:hypothetical protein